LAGRLVRSRGGERSGTARAAFAVVIGGRVIQPAIVDGVVGRVVAVPPVPPFDLHADPNPVAPALEMFTS
jgi:hypothetical protein